MVKVPNLPGSQKFKERRRRDDEENTGLFDAEDEEGSGASRIPGEQSRVPKRPWLSQGLVIILVLANLYMCYTWDTFSFFASPPPSASPPPATGAMQNGMPVTVPPGVYAGQTVVVTMPTGQTVSAVVPAGLSPGQQFLVQNPVAVDTAPPAVPIQVPPAAAPQSPSADIPMVPVAQPDAQPPRRDPAQETAPQSAHQPAAQPDASTSDASSPPDEDAKHLALMERKGRNHTGELVLGEWIGVLRHMVNKENVGARVLKPPHPMETFAECDVDKNDKIDLGNPAEKAVALVRLRRLAELFPMPTPDPSGIDPELYLLVPSYDYNKDDSLDKMEFLEMIKHVGGNHRDDEDPDTAFSKLDTDKNSMVSLDKESGEFKALVKNIQNIMNQERDSDLFPLAESWPAAPTPIDNTIAGCYSPRNIADVLVGQRYFCGEEWKSPYYLDVFDGEVEYSSVELRKLAMLTQKSHGDFFEWGGGITSTTAALLSTNSVTALAHEYTDLCSAIQGNPIVHDRVANNKSIVMCKHLEAHCLWDIPIAAWKGKGIREKECADKYLPFVEAINELPGRKYDVILVGSKFRRACAVNALQFLRDEHSVVVVPFYRRYEGALKKYFMIQKIVGTLGILRPHTEFLGKNLTEQYRALMTNEFAR